MFQFLLRFILLDYAYVAQALLLKKRGVFPHFELSAVNALVNILIFFMNHMNPFLPLKLFVALWTIIGIC